MRAAGGRREGATEEMEGMAVGGKSCCLLYGDDTAHSQVSGVAIIVLLFVIYFIVSHFTTVVRVAFPRLPSSTRPKIHIGETPHSIPLSPSPSKTQPTFRPASPTLTGRGPRGGTVTPFKLT